MYLFIDSIFTYYPKHSGLFDQNSDRLLRFKKGFPYELNFFRELLRTWMMHNLDGPTLICTIPSSNPNKRNSISVIASELCSENDLWLDGTRLITKRYATPSVCSGVKRHYGRFVNSFDISDAVYGHHVLLLDDVTTTGKSMQVIHDLLMDKCPTSIYCLALGHTKLV
jgi:predicted amidophosphoribosyltransferase